MDLIKAGIKAFTVHCCCAKFLDAFVIAGSPPEAEALRTGRASHKALRRCVVLIAARRQGVSVRASGQVPMSTPRVPGRAQLSLPWTAFTTSRRVQPTECYAET